LIFINLLKYRLNNMDFMVKTSNIAKSDELEQ